MLPPRPRKWSDMAMLGCWEFVTSHKYEKSSEPRSFKDNLNMEKGSCDFWWTKVFQSESRSRWRGIISIYSLSNTDDVSDKHACKNAQLHILDSLPNFMLGKCGEEDFSSFDSLTSFDSWCFLSLASLDESWRVFIPLAIGSVVNHKWNAWFKMNTLFFFLLGSAHSSEMTICMDSSSLVNSFLPWMVLPQKSLNLLSAY